LFERATYSHVRIKFESGWWSWSVLEAAGSSVRLIGEKASRHYPVKIHHRYAVTLSDDEYKRMLKLLRYAGVKYGTLQAIGIGLQRLFRLSKNPFADGDYSFICSELVAYFLFQVVQLEVPDSELPDFETAGPKAIKNWLDKHPEIARPA